ncbi:RHS repeat-associated core domain protein [Mizugakiibacter sediminis]|uniref:RHS repeat-associated core domain protein n=1 Tax=Mizugakiibacter sediminis TaxID=1475481 RepID=A0A0K8QQX6_9GAMM|nr:RHS repeat-associated core domain-containing protein [Mizugakiibacter sediminis]GAP66772.1 RHS repeat-associated core domain protein [Mizugakiibacter sediminis]
MRTGIVFALLASAASFVRAETVVYYHTDALGSPVAVTDANRNVIERTRYAPYGDTLNRPLHEGPGYTGHVTDATTGLIYMQQRYYDPTLGLFLSVDPVAVDGKIGTNFNRYWYANENPYRFTDPDGRRIVVNGTDDFKKKAQADIKKIAEGRGGKVLVEKLEATKNIILITQDSNHDGNSTQASEGPSLNGGLGKGSTVSYDPESKVGGKDANGSRVRPAYVGLAHELGHARAIDIGRQSYDMGSGKPGTTPPSEIHSMANENMVRQEQNLPVRPSYYDDGH